MKIPGFKRLQGQDYPNKYSDLIGGLFIILNQFMQNVTLALSGNLTYSDNFRIVDINIEIVAPVTNLKIKNTKGTMNGLHLAKITPKSDPTEIFSAAPSVQWSNTGDGQILIQNITGLTSGNHYQVRLLFYP